MNQSDEMAIVGSLREIAKNTAVRPGDGIDGGNCASCRFAVVLPETVVCRRFPPAPRYVVPEAMSPGDTMQGYWPRVGFDDWCGEWQSETKS